jgi:putative signal transducing protein
MAGEPTVIYSAANVQQAYLLKGLLEERGIAARVVNDAIQIAGGELPLGWTSAPQVVVAEADAAKARSFADEFDRRTARESAADDPVGEAPPNEWSDWPVCPACGERRSARCPICGVSATEFPLADLQDEADGTRVLLFCAACDDHFQPQWYRLCHRCGHDYGDGLDTERRAPFIDIGRRTWLVLAGLLTAAACFIAYFLWLFG